MNVAQKITNFESKYDICILMQISLLKYRYLHLIADISADICTLNSDINIKPKRDAI